MKDNFEPYSTETVIHALQWFPGIECDRVNMLSEFIKTSDTNCLIGRGVPIN